ncbi:hypothetical protein EXN66_Car007563 [Channa argus]|uniref:Uncharacterized protein n=1 Tax=Channa argus TaxID=215402 RepID=A0A6G1PPH4_CHAAH|nr:hypothetical protein EXN66_Car007563 [Channa argus]
MVKDEVRRLQMSATVRQTAAKDGKGRRQKADFKNGQEVRTVSEEKQTGLKNGNIRWKTTSGKAQQTMWHSTNGNTPIHVSHANWTVLKDHLRSATAVVGIAGGNASGDATAEALVGSAVDAAVEVAVGPVACPLDESGNTAAMQSVLNRYGDNGDVERDVQSVSVVQQETPVITDAQDCSQPGVTDEALQLLTTSVAVAASTNSQLTGEEDIDYDTDSDTMSLERERKATSLDSTLSSLTMDGEKTEGDSTSESPKTVQYPASQTLVKAHYHCAVQEMSVRHTADFKPKSTHLSGADWTDRPLMSYEVSLINIVSHYQVFDQTFYQWHRGMVGCF